MYGCSHITFVMLSTCLAAASCDSKVSIRCTLTVNTVNSDTLPFSHTVQVDKYAILEAVCFYCMTT